MSAYPFFKKLGRNINHYLKRRPAIFFANILVTYHCTQRCLQCTIPELSATWPKMSLNDFRVIIDKLDRYGTQGLSLSGGEPIAHPDLPELIAYASGKSFSNIHLLTTLYASEKVVRRTLDAVFENNVSLSCSFDGFGEVADSLRGGDHVADRVLAGINEFNYRNRKRTRPLGAYLNIVISQLNLYQIPEILQLAESIGWKVNVDLYRWQSENHREIDEMKIVDFDQLADMLELVKRSPNVVTPDWLVSGYSGYLRDDYVKYCPYLEAPTFGSKFFIHPNGDVAVCIGDHIGNLLTGEPEEIFAADVWANRKSEFHACRGCWNTCYTPAARFKSYFNPKDLKQAWQMIGRALYKSG